MDTLTYEADARVARTTLDRPERGNGITPLMPVELAECVERANLDPAIHVIALAGNGSGFCGGYDLVASAEGDMSELGDVETPAGSPLDRGGGGLGIRTLETSLPTSFQDWLHRPLGQPSLSLPAGRDSRW